MRLPGPDDYSKLHEYLRLMLRPTRCRSIAESGEVHSSPAGAKSPKGADVGVGPHVTE